ncbi:MAG: bifunctional 2',3'-cyclic-nucleotide 2'-phosphodiesterase/3'-nucleotidase [Vibrionaceae bacterium]
MSTTPKLGAAAIIILLCGCNPNEAQSPGDIQLRLIETSDIHSNLLGFDYYKNKAITTHGLSRTAVLIHKAREENGNTILVDNGDLIQGSPLADYVHEKHIKEEWLNTQAHPAIKALNTLKYDVGNLGNHEFNYGLDFLATTLQQADFPYVNANVFEPDAFKRDASGAIDWSKQKFTPYVILERQVKDVKRTLQTIKVGVLGLTPPQIMQWDKRNLEGKVVAADMVETAQHYVPEIKAKGADVVVVVAHTGIIGGEHQPMMENAALPIAKVAGIDALLLGHAHKTFPGGYPNITDVDNEKGTLAGVPTVMPGVWGNQLGVVDLTLSWREGRWQVVSGRAELREIDSSPTSVEDPAVVAATKEVHEHANAWLDERLSAISAPIHSFFALVQDDPSIEIINDAQRWYAETLQKDGVLTKQWPVLSAAAPFRGGRNGFADFTYVPKGDISLRNVADLYVFSNTLQVVEINGATLKEWLEMSATMFNQIDVKNTQPQWLVSSNFAPYNFDMIDGVNYQIDITKPARYNEKGEKISEEHRITNLSFNGHQVSPEQMFYVVTNNYRANGGGSFPGINKSVIVHEDALENREVLTQYLKILDERFPEGFEPKADNNWQFSALPSMLQLRFYGSPLEAAKQQLGNKFSYIETLPENSKTRPGFAVYQLNSAQ